MSSFFGAAARLILNRHPAEYRRTEEQTHAPTHALVPAALVPAGHTNAQAYSLAGAHHEGVPDVVSFPVPGAHIPDPSAPGSQRPIYVNPKEDSLTFFRLMLGIQTSPYLGFTVSGPLGNRPAANIGLYARIVHSEQKAKDSFKVFSITINACYFLQIVIAAALTALGAARASPGAVTAFGAINTIIAGFLTFLKGSGLPGRFKYYGNEWKKIREFIEQRERDFMRPGHNLDVYEVVETVEKMYNNLKADIQLNTPDSYTSVTGHRHMGDEIDNRIGGIDISKIENLAHKLKSLEHEKPEKLVSEVADKVEDLAKKTLHRQEKRFRDKMERVEGRVEKRFKGPMARNIKSRSRKARFSEESIEQAVQTRDNVREGKQIAKEYIDAVATIKQHEDYASDVATSQKRPAQKSDSDSNSDSDSGSDSDSDSDSDSVMSHPPESSLNLVKEISEIHRIAATGGRATAEKQILQLASRLDAGNGGDEDEEEEEEEPAGEGGKSKTRSKSDSKSRSKSKSKSKSKPRSKSKS